MKKNATPPPAPEEAPVQGTRHPWLEIAMMIEPAPMPSIVKFDTISVTTHEGYKEDAVLLTIGTPAGVSTVFMNVEDFDTMIANAQKIRSEISGAGLFVGSAGLPSGIDLSKMKGGK